MLVVTTQSIENRHHQVIGLVTSTATPENYKDGLTKIYEQAALAGANAVVGLIVQSIGEMLIFFGTAVKVI